MGGPVIRRAVAGDISAILILLVDDDLGKRRESTDTSAYEQAFAEIDLDPNQLLAVMDLEGHVVGCLQLTFIPGLSHGGMRRGQIEAVRIARSLRGQGLGTALMRWAIDQCHSRGCGLVQLMTDKRRACARRFYHGLGFTPSHEGMKLKL